MTHFKAMFAMMRRMNRIVRGSASTPLSWNGFKNALHWIEFNLSKFDPCPTRFLSRTQRHKANIALIFALWKIKWRYLANGNRFRLFGLPCIRRTSCSSDLAGDNDVEGVSNCTLPDNVVAVLKVRLQN